MVLKCNSFPERIARRPIQICERLVDHNNLRPVCIVLAGEETTSHKWYAECAKIVPRGQVVTCAKVLVRRRLPAFDRKAGVIVPASPRQIATKSGTAYARN